MAKLTIALILSGSLFVGALTAGAAAPSTPQLRLRWAVITRQCTIKAKRIAARSSAVKPAVLGGHHVRDCAMRAVRTPGRTLDLYWRQHGEVSGLLTLAHRPITGATITVEAIIRGWPSTATTLTTDAQGRFAAPIHGPADRITITYQPAGATAAITTTERVRATAHLSLHVGHLAARHIARFWGIVYGGYLPEDLYVQFWYLDGTAGWQPFARLTIVDRHNGHWRASVRIPAAARGYRYHIRATVVPSPDWPWAAADSRSVTRIVS